jgi:hypothetical protein
MTPFRQFEANRRNALRSTGPRTEQGKDRSRLNAVRHGLTAETVVGSLEDAEDYKAFEATIIADYCAETAVARELVLRLASLLWRLRRATAIETDLLELQAEALPQCQAREALHTNRHSEHVAPLVFVSRLDPHRIFANSNRASKKENTNDPHHPDNFDQDDSDFARRTRRLTYSFVRLASVDSGVFERLNRYEVALWRQAAQIMFTLDPIKLR